MAGRAIVPDHQRVRCPAEARLEIDPFGELGDQIFERRVALPVVEADDLANEAGAEEQDFLPVSI